MLLGKDMKIGIDRTTVFTLLSCQLCHFSTVHPLTHFPMRRGYIVLKLILVLCTPLRIGKYMGGREYCSKVDMITMIECSSSGEDVSVNAVVIQRN